MRRLFPSLILAAIVSVPRPATAQTAGGDDAEPPVQVVLSGDLVVPRGAVAGEVVVLHGTATVHGVATGDVVVLDGSIVVGGQVRGEVIALDGDVRLLGSAQVAGGVVASGEVQRAEDASVAGTVRTGVRISFAGPVEVLGTLLAPVAIAVSTLLALLLLLLLAPRGMDRITHAARSAPVASGAWGLVLALVVPAGAVLAVASVLGLPLGLTVLLSTGLLWLVGLSSAAWIVGRLLVREPRSRAAALAAGWVAAAAVGLVPILNVVWWVAGAIYGLGAVTVAAWRARGSSKHRVGAAPRSTFEGRVEASP